MLLRGVLGRAAGAGLGAPGRSMLPDSSFLPASWLDFALNDARFERATRTDPFSQSVVRYFAASGASSPFV